MMAGKIFVSYRRDDVPGDARGVRDALAGHFGQSKVFMDIDNLLVGQRFDQELSRALDTCDVLIAIMGPRWMELLKQRDASGERDFVREEIAAAIARDMIVIPVRAGRDGAMPPMPRAAELPPEIGDLVMHQKHDVAHERFKRDTADLVAAIVATRWNRQGLLQRTQSILSRILRRYKLRASVGVAGLAILAVFLTRPAAKQPAPIAAQPVNNLVQPANNLPVVTDSEKAHIVRANAYALYHDATTPSVGNSQGDVTLVEFFDYNCGYCKKSAGEIAQMVIKDPKLRIAFKQFPILSAGSAEAARVALAAHMQGKFFELHTALMETKGMVNEAVALEVASKLKLDMTELAADMRNPSITADLDSSFRLADRLKLDGTPTFVLGSTVITGAPENLVTVVADAVADLRKSGCKYC